MDCSDKSMGQDGARVVWACVVGEGTGRGAWGDGSGLAEFHGDWGVGGASGHITRTFSGGVAGDVGHFSTVRVMIWAGGEFTEERVFVRMGLGNFVLVEEKEDMEGLTRDEFKFRRGVSEWIDWFSRGFSSLLGLVFFC